MTSDQPVDYLLGLVQKFRELTQEAEWVEFKTNESDPREIGECISALANAAALAGKSFGYIVWGISAWSHAVVGTKFNPDVATVRNQPLDYWLLRQLEPKIHFRFFPLTVDGCSLVVLEIGRAFREPVQFGGHEYVREGSYRRRLKGLPAKAWMLWRELDQTPFENCIAVEGVRDVGVLQLLNYPAYLDLLAQPHPANRDGILHALANDRLIQPSDAGGWNVTNLGAVLFAKRLSDFRGLRRKAMRVVQYRGRTRTGKLREHVSDKGYASGFASLYRFIDALLPSKEVIRRAFRETVRHFPEPAVQEVVANALIHQDLSVAGTGPLVEIFRDRIEITNPGAPLVHAHRFVDCGPRSRNESLASFMARIGISEECGKGWTTIMSQIEVFQLPAPHVESAGGSTRVVMFAPRGLSSMDQRERMWAMYLHACLQYANHGFVTNASVRERFGMAARGTERASGLITQAIKAAAIVRGNPADGRKVNRYLPWWAKGSK